RRNQLCRNISSKLMTLGPDISPFGQIWTSDWLMYHHSDSMSMYEKFKIKDWSKFNGSNIGYSKANWSTEGVYREEVESSKSMTLGPEISPFGQIWTSDWLMYHHSDSMSMYKKFKIKDWNKFNGSNICYSMNNVSPEGINCDEIESSKLMTLGPDISPFGQIWIFETLT
ncbi:MAG: hypothetical protein ACRDCF_01355, partial [Mycoplasmoidaceae bacterium]